MTLKLDVNYFLWNKESNFLFDYETTDYTISKISTKSHGLLMRNDKIIEFKSLNQNTLNINNQSYLTTVIVKEDSNFSLLFERDIAERKYNFKYFEDTAWLVFRHSFTNMKNVRICFKKSFKIKEGDTVKFGKVHMTVREVFISKSNSPKKNKTLLDNKEEPSYPGNINIVGDNTNNSIINQNKSKKRSSSCCRICLCEDNEITNPLINPCKCSGTMKYIHIQCLKQWLHSKINIKENPHLTVYSFPSIECELCKSLIPELIRVRDELFSLLEFKRPENSYLMLETLPLNEKDSKHIYLIDMKETEKLKIGRANDSDIRITDISVSRFHSKLKIVNNEFYIEDNCSKFGTSLKIDSEFNIIPNKQLALQIGKYLATFNVAKTLCAYFMCYSFKYNNLYDYNSYLDTKFIKRKGTIKDIGYSNSEFVSQYESEKKEIDAGNNPFKDVINKDAPSILNANDKTEELNRSNHFTGIFLPHKNKYNNDNASVDEILYNPSSDMTRRGLLHNTKVNDASLNPDSLFRRGDEKHRENEREIELIDYDFIKKLRKPDSTGDLMKQESGSIHLTNDIKDIKICRNINRHYQSEESKKVIAINTNFEKNFICNSEQNPEFLMKNNVENEKVGMINSYNSSNSKSNKIERLKLNEKDRFLYNSVNHKSNLYLESGVNLEVKIDIDDFNSVKFEDCFLSRNNFLNNNSVKDNELDKKHKGNKLTYPCLPGKEEQEEKFLSNSSEIENKALESIKSVKNKENNFPIQYKDNNEMIIIERSESSKKQDLVINDKQTPKDKMYKDVDGIQLIEDFFQNKDTYKEPQLVVIDLEDNNNKYRSSVSKDKIDMKDIDTNCKEKSLVFREVNNSNDNIKKIFSVTEENIREMKSGHDKNIFKQDIRFLSETKREPINDFISLN